jgi:hypothetical protein
VKISVTILAIGVLGGTMSAASPLSTEPIIGLSSDYSTNPDLRATDERSEFHGAVLLNLPIHYDRDNLHLALLPVARCSNTRGYSSLASNFFRVDADASETTELGTAEFTGGMSRDSSLYHSDEATQGVGMRRDTATAGLSLQRLMTELLVTELQLNWTRTKYDESAASSAGLVSYRYISAAPTVVYTLNERMSVRLLASAGRFNSLDRITSSKDVNVQLGIGRDLTELWSLSASYGYSRSRNSRDFYFGPFFLGTIESAQRGSVYNATLKRKGERFTFVGTASRELKPSGFAFLSRQESVDTLIHFQYSERWRFSGEFSWRKSVDPVQLGADASRRNLYGQISAAWNWQPDWIVALRVTRVDQHFDSTTSVGAASSGVSLELSHQFARTDIY